MYFEDFDSIEGLYNNTSIKRRTADYVAQETTITVQTPIPYIQGFNLNLLVPNLKLQISNDLNIRIMNPQLEASLK